MGRLSKTGGKTVWKSNGKNRGFDVRPLAMEKQWKNRGTMMKKWSKTMEKVWKNCGSDAGRK